MNLADSGRVPVRIIAVQVALIGLVVLWLKVCLPRIERAHAAALAAERERRIEDFVQSIVTEDTSREVETPTGEAHPQRLNSSPEAEDVERALGAPQTSMTDFRGGYHLTWVGTTHQLEASFDKGRLYSLAIEDRATGHGAEIFESSDEWRPF